MSDGWDKFNKYIGVQGIIALALVGGFIFASVSHDPLPDLYTQLMTLVLGYYFAKNGVGILEKLAELLHPAASGASHPKK